jgi:hypothetical protein
LKLKKVPGPRLTPTSAFNALEADFFAREADLYNQTVETFEDLEHGGGTDPNLKIRPPHPQGTDPKKD